MEIMELLRQNVSVRDEIKLVFPEALLHLDIVVAQAVFARDFVALREMVDALVLVQALVHVTFARGGGPAKVPLVRLSHGESIGLEYRSYKPSLAFKNLVEHFIVVYVVPTCGALVQHWPRYQLLLAYALDFVHRIACHIVVRVGILRKRLRVLRISLCFEEVLTGASWRCPIILRWDEQRNFGLNVSQRIKNALKALCSHILLHLLLAHWKGAISVAHQRSAGAPRVVRIDADPARLELSLDHLEALEGRNITVTSRNLLLRIVVTLRKVSVLVLLTI